MRLLDLWKDFFLFPSAEWFWSQVNELNLWISFINTVYFYVCFSASVKNSLQTLPAQPVEICLLGMKNLRADQLQHFHCLTFSAVWLTL